jgi:hypothetical protein
MLHSRSTARVGTEAHDGVCSRRARRDNQEGGDWDWFHVEPSAGCMVTDDGQPAVDFVVRWVGAACTTTTTSPARMRHAQCVHMWIPAPALSTHLGPPPCRAETFEEDAQQLFDLLNEHRPKGLPALKFDYEWSNRGQTREERLQRVATKLQKYLDGETLPPAAMELLRNGLQRLEMDIDDKPALRQALKEVKKDAAASAGNEGEECGPELDDDELLECEQRRYAAMYSGCGVGCVRAFSKFIEPDLKVAGYAPGWPLLQRRHRAHNRVRERA